MCCILFLYTKIFLLKWAIQEQKINSSWNTHPIKIRFCRFLCIILRYLCVKFQRLTSFGWQDILIYGVNIPKYLCKSGRSKNKKNNSSWNTHPFNSRFCRFLCIMFRYLCVKFQRLMNLGWQDILIYIKVGNPRTKKLIVLGILTQSKKGRVHFFVL